MRLKTFVGSLLFSGFVRADDYHPPVYVPLHEGVNLPNINLKLEVTKGDFKDRVMACFLLGLHGIAANCFTDEVFDNSRFVLLAHSLHDESTGFS
jgi:hypothetical protein